VSSRFKHLVRRNPMQKKKTQGKGKDPPPKPPQKKDHLAWAGDDRPLRPEKSGGLGGGLFTWGKRGAQRKLPNGDTGRKVRVRGGEGDFKNTPAVTISQGEKPPLPREKVMGKTEKKKKKGQAPTRCRSLKKILREGVPLT